MNNYCIVPFAGTPGRHTTRTYISAQVERGQGTSATELSTIPTASGSNGQTIEYYTCYNCGRKVHKILFFSKTRRTCNDESQGLKMNVSLASDHGLLLNKNWIVLD